MSTKSSLAISCAIVVAALVAVGCLAWWAQVHGGPTLEKWSGIGSAASAVVGIFTLIVIVVYTRETFLLRIAADEQAEAQLRPVVLVEIAAPPSPRSCPIAIRTTKIQNAGVGMAFNVRVEALRCRDAEVEFTPPANLPAGETAPLEFEILRGGERNGCSTLPNLFGHLFEAAVLPPEISCAVTYESLSGRRYRTTQRIVFSDDRSVVTRFCKLEAIR